MQIRAGRDFIERRSRMRFVPALLLTVLVTVHLGAAHQHPLRHITVHPSTPAEPATAHFAADPAHPQGGEHAVVTDGDVPCNVRQSWNAPTVPFVGAAEDAPQVFKSASGTATVLSGCPHPRADGPTRQAILQRFTL